MDILKNVNPPNVGDARQRASRLSCCPLRIGTAGNTPGESRCAVRKGGVPRRLGRVWRSDRELAPWEEGVAEFSYRFNRRFSLTEMLPRLAFVALRTAPTPYRVLKLAENYP